MLTAEEVRSLLDYDPVTGEFTWKWRNDYLPQWNARYAGRRAGSLTRDGYCSIRLGGHHHKAHRLAWLHFYGELPSAQIDHINGERSDNRIANLRLATQIQNSANAGIRRANKSGFKGVSWDRGRRKFRAQIRNGITNTHLGRFDTPEEAHAAYVAAALKMHGDFTRTA